MPVCEIKWIDKAGNQTPDQNPAIQRVRIPEYQRMIGGRMVTLHTTPWYFCCAEHSKRLNDPGMEIWECAALEDEASLNVQEHERMHRLHSRVGG